MQRYESYKDSGIEWIGEIPEGWGAGFLKRACVSSLGKMLTSEPTGENSFRGQYLKAVNIQESGFNLEQVSEMFFNPEESTRYEICAGDLLVVEGGNVGLAQVWDGQIEPCYIQNALHRVRPMDTFDVRYLKYGLDVARYSGYVDLACNKATIAHFTKEKLGNTPMPMPSKGEQVLICDFLDAGTAEVDSLIADAEKSVELLEEYRKSIISEAVTKGLDPNAPMKDSDIEWIGEIPEGWELKRLKYLFQIQKRIAGIEGPSVLSVTQKGLRVKDTESGEGQLALDYSKYQWVYPGDFVMNHMDLLTGWVDCSEYEGVTSPDYRVFRARTPEVSNSYFLYVLQHCYAAKVFYSMGQGVSHLGRWRLQTSAFQNMTLPVPSLGEQVAIASYLDAKTAEIDSMVACKRQYADKLREYRKSLIYEAVTGKIKVPGVE